MTNTINPPKKKAANLQVEKLRNFEGHPFKVLDDEDMNNLTESIKAQSIISPLIVRPIENTDKYEVISGHRHLHAAVKVGLSEVSALIYPLDRNDAMIAVVDSNLHRERILPSEKAFAYKMKMEAMKAQGRRTDLTLSQGATKSDTAAKIGKAQNESRDQVFRYIRLTHLSPELHQKVDEGVIALSPAVELSYLSEVVRKIYTLCLAGRGRHRARQLEKEKILVLSAYYESIGRPHAQKVPANPYSWDQKIVVGILENRQYTGCAVNFKTTTVSYKVHKTIYKPAEEHQIISNMQEPIISEEQWLRVQELRKHRHRPTATGRTSLFSGLVYCADCGAKLHFCAAKSLKCNQEFWRCSNYKDSRGTCQIHYIRDVVLEKIAFEAISSLADFVKCHETVFLYILAKETNAMRQKEYKRLQQAIEQSTRKISEIDRLIEKVFEQNAAGILSDERFAKMLKNYEKKQKVLAQEVSDSLKTLQEAKQKVTDLRMLLRTLREMTDITELTPILVNSLIERIEVHNNDKSSDHCYVKVDIYFTAAGMIDIPTEREILAMIEEIRETPQDFRFVA